MDRKAKILILGYFDNPNTGHTWSWYKKIQGLGYNVCHLSLLSRYSNEDIGGNSKYFINAQPHRKLFYYLFRLLNKVRIFLSQHSVKDEYNFFNTSKLFVYNADSILKKIKFIPDIIIVGWCDYFISPKTLYELYCKTNADVYILMVDAHILGGGCHYPCDCDGYRMGCKSCPALSKKGGAHSLYVEKMKYLKDIPFIIVGSSYDAERAKVVPFLKDKVFIKDIYSKAPPFVKVKNDARKELSIYKDDYVIMCGAVGVSMQNKRKGFVYLIEAIKILSSKITSKKEVTLLVVGDGDLSQYIVENNIKILSLGYVSMQKLFTAFYASDVFVSPSIDDSGPMMVNFSILCGTPVVSFPIGIALDLVIPGKTGFLADFRDSESLSEGLYLFYLNSSADNKKISDNCISLMESYRNNKSSWLEKVFE